MHILEEKISLNSPIRSCNLKAIDTLMPPKICQRDIGVIGISIQSRPFNGEIVNITFHTCIKNKNLRCNFENLKSTYGLNLYELVV